MSMRRDWKTTVLFMPALLLAGAFAMAQAPQAANPATSLTPVTDAMLRDPPASDWLMWRRTYDGWATARSTRSTRTTSRICDRSWRAS